MKNINQYFKFKNTVKESFHRMSLCGKLEAIVGKYFVSGAGLPYPSIQVVYYDESIKSDYECVDLIKENIVAYITDDEKYAFVKESIMQKFIDDTKEYNLIYIPVGSFDDEEFWVDVESELPHFMKDILWLDDDFMNDENIPFDYEKFELIDSGMEYINPKHFSVRKLADILKAYKDKSN